jgi:hypothetical protein
MTPLTRQIGKAISPTGDEFCPAGSDSTSMMVVSGKLRVSKVARLQGAVAAAAETGASAPVAIMAMARTAKRRRLIRHLLFFVRWVEIYSRRSRLVQYYFVMAAIGSNYGG